MAIYKLKKKTFSLAVGVSVPVSRFVNPYSLNDIEEFDLMDNKLVLKDEAKTGLFKGFTPKEAKTTKIVTGVGAGIGTLAGLGYLSGKSAKSFKEHEDLINRVKKDHSSPPYINASIGALVGAGAGAGVALLGRRYYRNKLKELEMMRRREERLDSLASAEYSKAKRFSSVPGLTWKHTSPVTRKQVEKVMGRDCFFEDLVDLILEGNGGEPSKKRFKVGNRGEAVFKTLLSYNKSDKENVFDAIDFIDEYSPIDLPENYPFGNTPNGDLIYLDTVHCGEVYYYDHETGRTTMVARSLKEFLNGLY